MVWIIRLLCPEGHIIAAGTCEADKKDEPLLARSFVNFLFLETPVMTCEGGCYVIDLRTECADLDVHVEETLFKTVNEAGASLRDEAQQIRLRELLRQSRN